ncbi:MAG: hypothetical protein NTV34_21155 [Proteobacteria bacterium]|nr:hypothetical protein [Pseudomonadota bacterium]
MNIFSSLRSSRLIMAILCGTYCSAICVAEVPATPEVVISFAGKGTALPWDAGVLRAYVEDHPASASTPVAFVGTSSGAVPTLHFACFGLSLASVAGFSNGLAKMDPSLINAGVFGCKAQHPFLIVAANQEVLENRGSRLLVGLDYREIEYSNLSVWWKPEIFRALKETHPNIASRYLGRACTYFINESMLEILSRVPKNSLQCDLRVVSTTEEYIMAIHGSVAEPTYFPPIPEPSLSSIIPLPDPSTGEAFKVRERHYYGGFVIPTVAQDLRVALPNSHIIGTGSYAYGGLGAKVIRSFLLLDAPKEAMLARWWLDMEVSPSPQMWDFIFSERERTRAERMPGYGVLEKAGYDTGKACFLSNSCRPTGVRKPEWSDKVFQSSGI